MTPVYSGDFNTTALHIELTSVESTIRNLNERRSSILQQLNAYQSTFNKLPSEIMTEIFLSAVQCEPWDSAPSGDGKETEWVSPLLLGSICKSWRNTVWAIPQLWCHIPLVLSLKRYQSQIAVLSEWLPRTADCPLSIIITPGSEGADTWAKSPPVEAVSLIVPHSQRWRHFDFFLFASCYTQFSSISHRLPMLESLAVSSSTSILLPVIWSLFVEVPMLHRIRLSGIGFTHAKLPFAQLTHVTVSKMSMNECIDIFRRCHNIEHCSFVNTLDKDSDIRSQSIILEKLQSFQVDFVADVTGYSHLFNNISLPSAREITVTARRLAKHEMEIGFLFGAIVNFAFSGCRISILQSLTIQVYDFDEDKLFRLLKGTRQLLHFKLTKTSERRQRSGLNILNSNMLTRLMQEDECGFQCAPELRSFYYSGPFGCTIEELLLFLETRQEHGFLKQFTIPEADHWGDRILSEKTPALCERFEALVEGGMNISLVLGGKKWI